MTLAAFTRLEDIKLHCDQVFPNASPLEVESQIMATVLGTNRTYQLKVSTLGTVLRGADTVGLKEKIREIRSLAEESGFKTKFSSGPIRDAGYQIELSVYDKEKPQPI